MGRVALIDSDELCYKVALHYQQKYYVIKKDDKVLWRVRYKEEAVESIMSRDDLEIESYIEPLDPKGFQNRIDDIVSRILFNTNSTDIRFYLSGSSNFRYELATLQPYKGNRDSEKPIHLELVREEFRYRKAETVDFLEADDLMSINSFIIPNSVICSSDKDLKTVPSLNFDINKGVLQEIDKQTSNYNFYYQLLIGDSTDNIPSPYGLGEVSAKKFLDNSEIHTNYDKFVKDIKSFYYSYLIKRKKDNSFRTEWYSGQKVDEILWEVGNLLWMRRTLDPNERWSF